MIFSVVVAVTVVSLVAFLLWKVRALKHPHFDYGPNCKPFWGNFFELLSHMDTFHQYIVERTEQMGKNYAFTAPADNTVLVLFPNEVNLKHVLKDNFENYVLPRLRQENLHELFGSGIFASNGDAWRQQRKAASHLFVQRELKGYMTSKFIEHGEIVRKILGQMCANRDAMQAAARTGSTPVVDGSAIPSSPFCDNPNGDVVDMHDLFFRYTMECFAEIAFGERLHGLTCKRVPDFVRAFDNVQWMCMQRYFDLFWQLKRRFNLGLEKQLKHEMRLLTAFVRSVIARRRVERDQEGLQRKDLITHFMAHAAKRKQDVTDDQLLDLVLNFLVAGRDTTACQLSWFFYELNLNPAVEAKVIEEIDTLLADSSIPDDTEDDPFGDALPTDDPDMDRKDSTDSMASLSSESSTDSSNYGGGSTRALHLSRGFSTDSTASSASSASAEERLPAGTPSGFSSRAASVSRAPSQFHARKRFGFNFAKRMTYTEAALLETLRLHPSVPSDDKEAIADDTLPDGTFIPKGVKVMYSPYNFGRSAALWDKPLVFDPERFMGEKPSQYKFPSFNAGPRICLGQTLALLEAKVLVSMILSTYRLRLVPGQTIDYKVTVTLNMKTGMRMYPELRSDAVKAD